MADGKLVFPVKFDLEAAVKEASGDADKVLKRLDTMLSSRPLKLGIEIEQPKGGWDKILGDYGKGSINAMRKEMAKLVEQWNKLSEAQRITDQKSGAFTADAMKIINRYSQLVTASESYARSLEQIAAAAKKSADAEIRANQKAQAELDKRIARSQQTVAMLKAEEISLSTVAAKMKFYQQIADKSDFGTKSFLYATQQVERLGAQYQRLQNIMTSATGNKGKDLFNTEQLKQTLRGAESSIEQVKSKLRAVDQILARTPQDSFGFRRASEEGERLLRLLKDMEANTPKAQIKAQEQLQREWMAAKDQREREREKETQQAIANANRENQARQAAFNAQRQAGLERQRILQAEENSIAAVTAKLQLQQQRLNDAKVGSAKYSRLTEEVDRLTKKLALMQEALAATGKRVEALKAMREALSASEKTISGLNAKLKVYQERLNGLEVGSQKFNKTAAEVRRLQEELRKANQYLSDFQSNAFRGLSTNFTARQTEAVQNLRRQIDDIDKRFNMLYQNGRATNADGTYTDRVNAMLKERMRLTEEINRMMKTAADAQLEREKEINRLIERRNAKNKEQQAAYNKAKQAGLEQYRILKNQEKTVSEIAAKLQLQRQRLNNTNLDSAKFNKIAAEVERLTQKLEKAQRKVAELTGQTTTGAQTQRKNVREVTQEYSRQLIYLEKVMRRLAVYGSIGMIGNLVRNVREVTAQFELQRVSLGAILQDQTKANQLFSEIKGFALKSPVSILDLTKYTKQLAAYKIGYDELFETTKKLTDVSVGLGVSMDRVVLAYGQVRATGHLRASEIRQFTEMGVPIVEELAAKLSKMNGELVTAADVMDMVSKRAIGFDMVKEVFDDMTSAGGVFYNMQEKQGNTLYGLWAKLGDAASVMYDEIGRTGAVNATMKGLIQLTTDLMKNWRLVAGELFIVGTAIGIVVTRNKINATTTALQAAALNKVRNAGMAYNAILAEEAKLLKVGTAAQLQSVAARKANAKAALDAAIAERTAANATGFWTRSVNKLKAALMGNWVTLLITVGTAIGVAIGAAIEKATRLKRALAEIREETTVLQNQSTRNFERLVEQATENADGSKKQKEALDELNRTYKDMLPEEALRIENLRKMKGNYEELTQAVREYIAAQQEEKSINTINEQEGAVQTAMQKRLRGVFEKQGFSSDEIERFFRAFERTALDTSKTVREQFDKALELAGIDGGEKLWGAVKKKLRATFTVGYSEMIFGEEAFVKSHSAIGELSRSIAEQEGQIEAVRKSYAGMTQDLGVYTGAMRNYNQAVQENLNSDETMLQNQENVNMQVRYMASWIKDAVKEAGIAWNEGWSEIIKDVDAEDLNRISSLNMDAILSAIDPNKHPELYKYIQSYKKMYEDLVPSDPVAKQIRAKFFEIANSTGASIDTMRRFLWDGKTALDDHIKSLDEQITKYETDIYRMNAAISKGGILGNIAQMMFGGKIEEQTKMLEALRELMNYEKTYVKEKETKNKGGRQSDPRLQNLKEEISLVQKLYQEYKQLEKQEGATKATADMNRMAKDTIAMLSKKYGIGLPKTANDVVTALEILYGKMEQLPRKVFPSLDKDLKELRWTIEKVDIDDSQKNIEAELKKLADRISRTKTAREFYDKILSQTGDVEMAGTLTMDVFGDTGENLFSQTVEQLQTYFSGIEVELPVNFDTEEIDYRKLRGIWEADKALPDSLRKIPEQYDSAIKQILDSADSSNQKMIEGWLKAVEKAKTYGDKLADVYRKTATEIEAIQKKMDSGQLGRGVGSDLIAGFKRKEAEEVAKLQYEAFKDSPMYVQMFDDLDNASTRMLKNMKARLIAMQGEWKNLDPTQLKELQSRLNEIDSQLARRNPFKTLADGMREYYNLRTKGDARGNRSRKDADNDVLKWTEEYIRAQEQLAEVMADESSSKEQVAIVTSLVNHTKKQKEEAEKVAENWKKVEDAIGLSSSELMQMLNWAGDIAGAVAEISEALGADEEDVQYWNTVADSLTNIAGGIQDIVSAAMSGNVIGVISSTLTAIPKMFVGFVNLFNAGRIRKANKEIKRQQELLEQLEYTYSRLQAVADKLFGRDYISNYNQQLRNLEAQAEAYQKQAEAEKSKGKKTDKEKLKEYENSYRDTMDEIADMQTELVEKFTGTDVASAAKEFADSWLDAYLSFGNTADAIKEKFNDMIKNMIVESVLAQIVQRSLKPIFDEIDERAQDGELSANDIVEVMSKVPKLIDQIDNGLTVGMKSLESLGLDLSSMREDSSEYKGIAKNVASATSEEINANTAALNTQNYYLSQVPVIGENVAAIRMILQGGSATVSSGTGAATTIDYTDLLTAANQHLASLPRMERHLSDIYTLLNRVVVYEKGRFVVSSIMRG